MLSAPEPCCWVIAGVQFTVRHPVIDPVGAGIAHQAVIPVEEELCPLLGATAPAGWSDWSGSMP